MPPTSWSERVERRLAEIERRLAALEAVIGTGDDVQEGIRRAAALLAKPDGPNRSATNDDDAA